MYAGLFNFVTFFSYLPCGPSGLPCGHVPNCKSSFSSSQHKPAKQSQASAQVCLQAMEGFGLGLVQSLPVANWIGSRRAKNGTPTFQRRQAC